MTLGELIDAAMCSEASPHSNGKFYTLEEVKNMELVFPTVDKTYETVVSVYPGYTDTLLFIDIK